MRVVDKGQPTALFPPPSSTVPKSCRPSPMALGKLEHYPNCFWCLAPAYCRCLEMLVASPALNPSPPTNRQTPSSSLDIATIPINQWLGSRGTGISMRHASDHVCAVPQTCVLRQLRKKVYALYHNSDQPRSTKIAATEI